MKLKSILVSAGLLVLAATQTASATSITLQVRKNTGTLIHQYVRYGANGPTSPTSAGSGDGFVVALNLGAAGSSGQMTFTNGGGSTVGSWALTGNSAVGNNTFAYGNPNTPQFLRDAIAQDSIQTSFTGTVGPNDNFHIIDALLGHSYVSQGITGLAAGSIIDQDQSAPLAYGNPSIYGLAGYTGAATLWVHNGAADPRINLGPGADGSPTCNATSPIGCIGDQTNLLRPGFNGQQTYMQVRYDGFVEELSADGNFWNTYQLFSVIGQNALVNPNTGITRAHQSILGVQLQYLSGTRAVNGGPGGPSVPEPMTMGLLGSAMGLGALRRRFKKA